MSDSLSELKRLEDIIKEEKNKINDKVDAKIKVFKHTLENELTLKQYALNILMENYDRIVEIYKPNREYKEQRTGSKEEGMLHQTIKSIQKLKELKDYRDAKIKSCISDKDIISEYEKEHSGIFQDWVRFDLKEDVAYKGTPNLTVYLMTINKKGAQILERFEKYQKS